MQLTHEEIDLLSAALDSHIARQREGSFVGDMLTALVAKTDEQREEFERHMHKQKQQKEAATRRMADQIVLLKAKLISFRQEADSTVAEGFVADCVRGD